MRILEDSWLEVCPWSCRLLAWTDWNCIRDCMCQVDCEVLRKHRRTHPITALALSVLFGMVKCLFTGKTLDVWKKWHLNRLHLGNNLRS